MGHKITENDYVAASSGTWHNLEVPLEEGLTVSQALTKYGNNTAVETPVFVADPAWPTEYATLMSEINAAIPSMDKIRAAAAKCDTTKVAEGWKSIRRADNGDIHDIVTGTYSMCQFRQLAELADQYLQDGGGTLISIGTVRNGGRMFACIEGVPVSFSGDKHLMYRNFVASHDRSCPVMAADSGTRIICDNTFGFFQKGVENSTAASLKFSHSGDIQQKLQTAKTVMRKLDELKKTNLELFNKLGQVEVDELGVVDFDASMAKDVPLAKFYNEVYAELFSVADKDLLTDEDKSIQRVAKLRQQRQYDGWKMFRERLQWESNQIGVAPNWYAAFQAMNGFLVHDKSTIENLKKDVSQRRSTKSFVERYDSALTGSDAVKNGKVWGHLQDVKAVENVFSAA